MVQLELAGRKGGVGLGYSTLQHVRLGLRAV